MSESAVLPTLEAARAGALRLRPIESDDRDAAARIVYEAFAGIHDHHRFPRDFPTLEACGSQEHGFGSSNELIRPGFLACQWRGIEGNEAAALDPANWRTNVNCISMHAPGTAADRLLGCEFVLVQEAAKSVASADARFEVVY